MKFRVQFYKISTNGTKARTEEKSWRVQIVKYKQTKEEL